jgi:hypothetical protein
MNEQMRMEIEKKEFLSEDVEFNSVVFTVDTFEGSA